MSDAPEYEQLPTKPGSADTSRREFVKKAALAGGVIAWAVPTVQTIDLKAAGAAGTPSPVDPTTEPTLPQLTGSVTGTVIDASKGTALAGVTVATMTGATTTTAADGTYALTDVPAETQVVSAALAGYATATFSVVVAAGVTTTQDFALSRLGDLRIVLAWNNVDSDLDLHASGPDGNGGRFHVSFADKQPVEHASLDIDDTTFEGPEAITVRISSLESDFVAGDYHVWIHNYPAGTDASDITDAAPVVTFFDRTSQAGQWNAGSASGTPTNRIWRVFDFSLNDAGEVTGTSVVQTFLAGDESNVF